MQIGVNQTWRPHPLHGDRKGRHYYTRKTCNKRSIVVATLAVAMSHALMAKLIPICDTIETL